MGDWNGDHFCLPPTVFCREVRKDMINYCEDSGSSSSTDEEDLVPRTKLRRRAQINYNENDMQRAQEESDDNCDPAPARYNLIPTYRFFLSVVK